MNVNKHETTQNVKICPIITTYNNMKKEKKVTDSKGNGLKAGDKVVYIGGANEPFFNLNWMYTIERIDDVNCHIHIEENPYYCTPEEVILYKEDPTAVTLTFNNEEKKDNNVGRKHDNGKPDMQLIPPAALFEEAAVWTYGKKKYDAWNWHNGIKYSRVLSALERHLVLLKSGQDYDYENGLHNAAAIRCCAGMLLQFHAEGRTDLDDRIPMKPEHKQRMDKLAQGMSIKDMLESEKEK